MLDKKKISTNSIGNVFYGQIRNLKFDLYIQKKKKKGTIVPVWWLMAKMGFYPFLTNLPVKYLMSEII